MEANSFVGGRGVAARNGFRGTALSYQARARQAVNRRMMTVRAEKVRRFWIQEECVAVLPC